MSMRSFIFAATMLLISAFSLAQNIVHPYVAGGFVLNGSGQDNIGGSIAGGVQIDAKHLFSYSEAGYDTGGKTNDNSNTSSVGHDRTLVNQSLVRIGDWYAGVGVDWLKFYTPAYNKSHIHPKATVGRELHNGYINKVLVSYVHPGTDWQNGVTGIEAQGWWTGKHLFLRMLVGGYRHHDTVIPVSQGGSPSSVASELSHHGLTSQFQMMFGVRI